MLYGRNRTTINDAPSLSYADRWLFSNSYRENPPAPATIRRSSRPSTLSSAAPRPNARTRQISRRRRLRRFTSSLMYLNILVLIQHILVDRFIIYETPNPTWPDLTNDGIRGQCYTEWLATKLRIRPNKVQLFIDDFQKKKKNQNSSRKCEHSKTNER